MIPRIDSSSLCSLAESIPGLLKRLQIRALVSKGREQGRISAFELFKSWKLYRRKENRRHVVKIFQLKGQKFGSLPYVRKSAKMLDFEWSGKVDHQTIRAIGVLCTLLFLMQYHTHVPAVIFVKINKPWKKKITDDHALSLSLVRLQSPQHPHSLILTCVAGRPFASAVLARKGGGWWANSNDRKKPYIIFTYVYKNLPRARRRQYLLGRRVARPSPPTPVPRTSHRSAART